MDNVSKFISGFKQLIEETNLTTIVTGCFGLVQFKFKDGSYIGAKALMNRIGFNWQ